MTIHDLPTPCILLDTAALDKNITRMQEVCDHSGTALWPHIKTHKCVEILRRQLRQGAKGITCAKIGEAEAMLPSGVKEIFLAHSLVNPQAASRLKALSDRLDRLILAVTSSAHAEHLDSMMATAGLHFPVFVALDTGLGREGARSLPELENMVAILEKSRHLTPVGLYTHEGHLYRCASMEELNEKTDEVYQKVIAAAKLLPADACLAPGCSVSAAIMATKPGINMVRPGAYVLGDMNLSLNLPLMPWEDCAATIFTTVVDRPEKNLALIDAGSKTFSGDKNKFGESARALHDSEMAVSAVNEEHGYIRGDLANTLKIGQRLRFVPTHICPVMNLTDSVHVIQGEEVIDTWKVEGRGKVL